jgi:uncharacterized phage protein gp47/JayE
MIPRPSEQELLNRIHNRIRNETPITAGLDSTLIGVILRIIAAEMNLVWGYVTELEKQSNLSTATGTSLDNFGMIFGVPRREAQPASTAGYTRAVRFSNVGNANVVVPSGTRVFKDRDPQVAFFTTEGVTLTPGNSSEVHVSAASEGDVYNVGISELNRHSLSNVSILVTNILPIQNGSFQESDAAYRERLFQELTRRDALNVFNTDAMLRSVPGVKDVFVIDFSRGAGTFDAVIIPFNEGATSNVVSECQRLLNEFVPVGISALAKPPKYRQLDIRVNLRFKPDVGEKKEFIRESIRAQTIARIDNLPVEDGSGNGTFYVGQIRAAATVVDSSVIDAMVVLGIDGSPLAPEGEVRLGIGERIVLRSLSVE